jgi:regulator of sigma E protease
MTSSQQKPEQESKLKIILPAFGEITSSVDLETDYGLRPYAPNPYVEVEIVAPNQNAYRAGLRQGDRILAISNISGATTFYGIIDGIHNSPDKEIILKVQRRQKILSLPVTPQFAAKDATFATIGFVPKQPITYVIRHSPIESIGITFESVWRLIYVTGLGLSEVISGNIQFTKAFGSLPSMAIIAQQRAHLGLGSYFDMVAVLSLTLGIINLVPFPVLDGGHLLYFALEKIRKKPLSIKTLEILTKFGVAVLVSFMIYLMVNDLISSGILSKFVTWLH